MSRRVDVPWVGLGVCVCAIGCVVNIVILLVISVVLDVLTIVVLLLVLLLRYAILCVVAPGRLLCRLWACVWVLSVWCVLV